MPENGMAARRRRTIPLTRSQLETAAGWELLALCAAITADGKVTDDELRALEAWLKRHEGSDLPAVAFLRTNVDAILADAVVNPSERRDLAQALERVLPPGQRLRAREARERLEQQARVEAGGARVRNAESSAEGEHSYDFMVAGVRHGGRVRTIREQVVPGAAVELVRDRANAFSRNAVEVRVAGGPMIGYVPEFLAEEMAPLLDRGCGYRAHFKNVLRARDIALIPVVVVTLLEPGPDPSSIPLPGPVLPCVELLRSTDVSNPASVIATMEQVGPLLRSDLESIHGDHVGLAAIERHVEACSQIEPAFRSFFARSPVASSTYVASLSSLTEVVHGALRCLRLLVAHSQASADSLEEAAHADAVLRRIDGILGAAPVPATSDPTPRTAEVVPARGTGSTWRVVVALAGLALIALLLLLRGC